MIRLAKSCAIGASFDAELKLSERTAPSVFLFFCLLKIFLEVSAFSADFMPFSPVGLRLDTARKPNMLPQMPPAICAKVAML